MIELFGEQAMHLAVEFRGQPTDDLAMMSFDVMMKTE